MATKKIGLLLEAEVAPSGRVTFEKRYYAATGIVVSPGTPEHYQSQINKWGAELRVYFNDHEMATEFKTSGVHVEGPREEGYKSGEYRYRINDNSLWWKLVEEQGMRLGRNE
ncbi:hypothetical protein [uncultured Thiocystis sp.]|jgi:hypothetical protein|uniref:hypothetical protein n=1 Tax=uncultured Thiocystis sp. TaxID=1202134 RepID=UPI0025F51FEF|nr:hypothetical protein [uncultured Thiocystis sp.]